MPPERILTKYGKQINPLNIAMLEEYAKESKFCKCGCETKLSVTHCAHCGGIMDVKSIGKRK